MAQPGSIQTHDTRSVDAIAKIDPFAIDLNEESDERSNVIAFLLGGIFIAGGLLTFLYFDGDHSGPRGLAQNDGFLRIESALPKSAGGPDRPSADPTR